MNDGVLIIGAGYVGMSHALGFAKNCEVKVLDIDQEKVNKINDGDLLINEHHHDSSQNLILNVEATTDRKVILEEYKYVLICLPTDLNDESGDLETTIISDYIKYIIDATKSYIIIKSTVPIGYTQSQIDEYGSGRILFSPEFISSKIYTGKTFFDSRDLVNPGLSESLRSCLNQKIDMSFFVVIILF